MNRAGLALGWLLAAPAVAAQTSGTIEIQPLENPLQQEFKDRSGFETVTRQAVETAGGAVIRALDKVSGEVREIELSEGETTAMGLIEIQLGECRFPQGNPAGDAFAWIEVRTPGRGTTDFEGWMIASSPALNALDHARYDVWVMRCTRV
jgi:hypothetical protein